MKVYALREKMPSSAYMPVRGFHTSLTDAKKQGNTLLGRAEAWDVALYLAPNSVSHSDWIDMLNGDSISSDLAGKVPRDFLVFQEVAFQSSALKRQGDNTANG